MNRYHFYATIIYIWLLFNNLPFTAGQDVSAIPEAENSIETDFIDPFKITVNVSEIRLDVVVLDNKGYPIKDLTADDFEIYQDKLPQNIVTGVYIENQSDTVALATASRKDAPNLTKFPTTVLKEEEIRRTIIFVVDNLSLIEFDDLYHIKMSIKSFLDKQMQPGDLVAVMSTSYGNSALNFFSSDKIQMSRRVDSIPFEPVTLGKDGLYRIYENQLATLSYCIRALKDMPGRKILIFMSSYPTLRRPLPVIIDAVPVDYYELYGPRFERLADDALRAGVVVHSMDPIGSGSGFHAGCRASVSTPPYLSRSLLYHLLPFHPLHV